MGVFPPSSERFNKIPSQPTRVTQKCDVLIKLVSKYQSRWYNLSVTRDRHCNRPKGSLVVWNPPAEVLESNISGISKGSRQSNSLRDLFHNIFRVQRLARSKAIFVLRDVHWFLRYTLGHSTATPCWRTVKWWTVSTSVRCLMVFLMGNWNRQPPRFYSSASASWGCIIFISSRIFCFSIPPWSIGPLVLMVFAGVSGHLGPTLIGSIRRVHRRTIFGTGLDTGATVDLVGPRAIQQTWGKTHGEVCFWLGLLQVATKTKDDDMFTPFTLVYQWFIDGIQTKTSTEIIAGDEKKYFASRYPHWKQRTKGDNIHCSIAHFFLWNMCMICFGCSCIWKFCHNATT